MFKFILKSFIFFTFIFMISCQVSKSKADQSQQSITDSIIIDLTEFKIPNTSIRALEVLNDSTIWFAGSNGYWGYTRNSGASWHIEQIKSDSITPEFRSISITENGSVFIVSIANPAAILKSTDQGKNWLIVYSDSSENAFFDAIEFWNNDQGILLGDAIDQCFHIATTSDGGNTWKKIECKNLPKAFENENPFAASNTNISLHGSHAWFGTGGKDVSRVYHSSNYGKDWEVLNTPIISGKTMTGIYSIHFIDSLNGIIAGGNWENVTEKNNPIAITQDGGQSWKPVVDTNLNGYVSCIQFVPNSNGQKILALSGRSRGGDSEMYFSNNHGNSWQV
jgi:photosystem II stability/assembly factor-like uncharacterized protein